MSDGARKLDPPDGMMPLRELENSGAKVIAHVRASGHAVIFTEDDKPAVVLLTAAQFNELADRRAFVDEVHEGLADVETGRTLSTSELKARLEKRFGPLT